MNKRWWTAAVSAAAVALALAGCSLAPRALRGVWSMSDVGLTETVEFKGSSFVLTDEGATNGVWEARIEEVDEAAGHLRMETTASSGDLAGFTVGGEWFVLYDITADQLFLGLDATDYPTTLDFGPYTKS